VLLGALKMYTTTAIWRLGGHQRGWNSLGCKRWVFFPFRTIFFLTLSIILHHPNLLALSHPPKAERQIQVTYRLPAGWFVGNLQVQVTQITETCQIWTCADPGSVSGTIAGPAGTSTRLAYRVFFFFGHKSYFQPKYISFWELWHHLSEFKNRSDPGSAIRTTCALPL
jgi:hypothetical protein